MRILVLFAHPVETSFAAALYAKLVGVLREKGHKVDDCDLNLEGFDPVMSRQELSQEISNWMVAVSALVSVEAISASTIDKLLANAVEFKKHK